MTRTIRNPSIEEYQQTLKNRKFALRERVLDNQRKYIPKPKLNKDRLKEKRMLVFNASMMYQDSYERLTLY